MIQNCIWLLKRPKIQVRHLVLKIVEKIILISSEVNEDWSHHNHVMFESLPSLINTLISSSNFDDSTFIFKVVLEHKDNWKSGDIMEQFEPFPPALNEALKVVPIEMKEFNKEIGHVSHQHLHLGCPWWRRYVNFMRDKSLASFDPFLSIFCQFLSSLKLYSLLLVHFCEWHSHENYST